MTDQSRVEAVARALDPDLWKEYDRLRSEGVAIHELFVIDIWSSKERAEIAIEANDAWLKEQEPMLKPCPSCEEPCSIEEMECSKCGLALW